MLTWTARLAAVTTPITVFLLDDHEIVRRGLVDLLESHDDFRVVGEAGTAAEALPAHPDARAAGRAARRAAARRQRHRRVPRGPVDQPRASGASSSPPTTTTTPCSPPSWPAPSGYLLKQIRGPSLTEAVATSPPGTPCIDPALVERLLERIRRPDAEGAGRRDGHDGTTARRPIRHGDAGRRTLAPADPDRPRAGDPRPHRRGPDQPADRRAAVPGREDRQELRLRRCSPSSASSAAPRRPSTAPSTPRNGPESATPGRP